MSNNYLLLLLKTRLGLKFSPLLLRHYSFYLPFIMAEKDIVCVVSSGDKAVFLKINSVTTMMDIKFDASERLKIPYESLSLSYKDEATYGNLNFPIENEDDLASMMEHCRNVGLKEIHVKASQETEDPLIIYNKEQDLEDQQDLGEQQDIEDNSKNKDCGLPASTSTFDSDRLADKIPNDNPTAGNVMMIDDMINNSERIPAWWHTALTEEGQRFDGAKELRLALQYYSFAKKFEYEFEKNEPKRIRVCCRFKITKGCPWKLFASPPKDENRLEIKKFVNNHTCGQHGNNAGQRRASRQFIATQLQPMLKDRPNIRPIDVKKELLSSFGLRVEYSKVWWGKERAQEQLYGDAHEAYDQLRW